MRTFFDSSALAKRYIREKGSDEVEKALTAASEAAVSLLCPSEIVSALSRLRRAGVLASDQYELAKAALLADAEDLTLYALTPQVVAAAIGLLEKHELRTLDALHVAAALEWEAELFVSADRRQLRAAEGEGLRTAPV